jgi:hypothetical protein
MTLETEVRKSINPADQEADDLWGPRPEEDIRINKPSILPQVKVGLTKLLMNVNMDVTYRLKIGKFKKTS